MLSDLDLYLLGEGTHLQLYDKLGAHPLVHEGVPGVAFAVFAPNAKRVSVVGDFNNWDGRRHAMRVRGNGFWEIFAPAVAAGDKYKFEILGADGKLLPLKSDPVAFAAELRPQTASIVVEAPAIDRPSSAPAGCNAREAPISIYEVHLGSWRRRPDEGHRWLTYRELADELPAYVRDLNFTHVEFLPVTEHPFDGSWGYQPTGMFAPTSRFGSPADFAALVDACHRAGLGVILDWVPGHFPDDAHGLARFDGTALYEHADAAAGAAPRLGYADLQSWAHRGRQLPARERAVLARSLQGRRPARRCGRIDALSRLQPARRRLDSEQVRRPRKSRSARVPAPLQYGSVRALPARDHRGRGIDGLADGVAARCTMAASASATSGTWGG